MKFWKKIFLYSVTLTLILITAVGVIFIEKMHNSNLERAITEAIENQKNIVNFVYLGYDMDSIYSKYNSTSFVSEGNNLSDNFDLLLRNYAYSNTSNIDNIQVFNLEDKQVAAVKEYKINGFRELLDELKGNKSMFSINNDNGRKVVLVGSEFKIQNENYKLILTKDIDYLYKERLDNYKFFLILSAIIEGLLILGMYIISKRITKPIVNLADVSIEISNGKYNKRSVDDVRKDEVGILAKNFNNMLEALQLKMSELEDLNLQQERFINNLTHELKTPITSIIGYSDLLLRANVNDDIKEKSLLYINAEGRRLEKLSSTLIKLIRVKNEEIEIEKVNIKDCIYKSVNVLRDRIDDKKINIVFNEDGNDNSYILADNQLIIVLIKNILENAIKASKENNDIIISNSIIKNKIVEVKIRDCGSGIPSEDLEKILEPFYMIDKSREKSNNSMGLGLSICNEICKLFKINLNIFSEDKNGTEVVLTFALEKEE